MGFTPNVVDGNIILASWGNEVRDRSAQVFATAAERDSQWAAPPNGALAVTLDTNTLWRRIAGAWTNRNPFTWATVAIVTTDIYGNYGVNPGVAGAKIQGIAANGASTDFPSLEVWNTRDGGPGGATALLNHRHPDGTPWASVTVQVSLVVVYIT